MRRHNLRAGLALWTLLLTASAALAEPAPLPTPTPSRQAEKGCQWRPFDSPSLGLRMFVQECAAENMRYVFSSNGDWIEAHRPSDDATFNGPRQIKVFRKAAEMSAARAKDKGPALIRAGRKAAASGSVSAMIAADMAFHEFIYALSGNPLVAPAMQTHWTHAQRVMGEVLMRDDKPRDIWDQHEALLEAVASGKGTQAERMARQHIIEAADFMIARLKAEGQGR